MNPPIPARRALFLPLVPPALLAFGSLAPGLIAGDVGPVTGNVKLNGPLPEVTVGNVGVDYAATSDGDWVVYRADQEANVIELFSVPTSGRGEPIRLNEPISWGDIVWSGFEIAPDDQTVVFRTGQVSEKLWSVPIDGSADPVLIATATGISAAAISPDSTTVVYRQNKRLFRVPVEGGAAPVQITDSAVNVFSILGFSASGDIVVYTGSEGSQHLYASHLDTAHTSIDLTPGITGNDLLVNPVPPAVVPSTGFVVYRAERNSQEVLFAAPIDGSGSSIELNGPMQPTGQVRDFAITSDGDHVAYNADQDVEGIVNLYSVAIDGGATTQLNPALDPGGQVLSGLEITPDSTRVVYRAQQASNAITNLFVVDVGGPATPIALTAAPAGTTEVLDFTLSDDSRWAVYRALADGASEPGTFTAPLDGAAPPFALSVPTSSDDYEVAPGSAHVVLRSATDPAGLYSVPVDGSGSSAELSGDLAEGGDVEAFALTLAGGFAVYSADQEEDGVREIFSAPIDGSSEAEKLNDTLHFLVAGEVWSFEVNKKGTHAAYVATQADQHEADLFTVPLDGSGPPIRLTGGFVDITVEIVDYAFSEGSEWLVYLADQNQNLKRELFVVPADGSTDPEQLSAPLPNHGSVSSFKLEGDFALYTADEVDERVDLFSVPLDGSGPAVRLHDLVLPSGDVWSYVVDRDNSRVVYTADHETPDMVELYSVPIDGSAAPVKINPPLAPGGNVIEAAMTTDGEYVVYRADQDVENEFEIFAAPADGSQTAIQLNRPLVPGGDVLNFRLNRGQRVVYRADKDTDNQYQLYSVRVDGTGDVRISGDLPGDVHHDFTIARGGHVVYTFSHGIPTILELFTTRVDGSGSPVKLNSPLQPLGFIDGFLLDKRGRNVVYRADAVVDNQYELFGVPADGSAAPVRLNPELPPGSTALLPADTDEQGRALYLSDLATDNQLEAWVVPVLGGPSVRVNGPFPSEGDVTGTPPVLSKGRAFCLANQEAPEARELFMTTLDLPPTGAQ